MTIKDLERKRPKYCLVYQEKPVHHLSGQLYDWSLIPLFASDPRVSQRSCEMTRRFCRNRSVIIKQDSRRVNAC